MSVQANVVGNVIAALILVVLGTTGWRLWRSPLDVEVLGDRRITRTRVPWLWCSCSWLDLRSGSRGCARGPSRHHLPNGGERVLHLTRVIVPSHMVRRGRRNRFWATGRMIASCFLRYARGPVR